MLADAIEAGGVVKERDPDDDRKPSGAFGAEAAALYCGIGMTLLRERGPAARHVGGRTIWLRDELDDWLRALPAESAHRRGRRQSPVRRAHGAAQ